MRIRFSLPCGVLALLLGALPAAATIVTIEFTGAVTLIDDRDGIIVSDHFSIGDPIIGSFSYDTTTPGIVSGQPGNMAYSGALVSLEFTVGPYSGSLGSTNTMNVRDDSIVDQISIDADQIVGPDLGGSVEEFFTLIFTSFSTDTLSSNDLPEVFPPPPSFDMKSFRLDFEGPGGPVFPGPRIFGTIVIPEPTTAALLGLGLAGVGLARRRDLLLDRIAPPRG